MFFDIPNGLAGIKPFASQTAAHLVQQDLGHMMVCYLKNRTKKKVKLKKLLSQW